MKLIIIKFTAFLFLITLSTCSIDMLNRIEGNKNVTSVKRDINEDFTKVKVSTGIELIIDQGSEISLTVEADENLHDIIITEVEDGKLKIYTEKNIWKSASKKVYLTVNTLEELKATSGSNVITTNVIKATDLHIGSSSGATLTLEVTAVNLISSTSSGASISVHASESIDGKASSGGSISFEGNPEKITRKTSSGGSISGS